MGSPDNRTMGEKQFDRILGEIDSRQIGDTEAIVRALLIVFQKLEEIGASCDRAAQIGTDVASIRSSADKLIDRTTP
jgi:hypothetical protein